jgi:DNA-binding transcriptional MocR family regulator
MAQDWEPEFIRLWQQGLETAAIAQALGIPVGTVSSRAHVLQLQGKIQRRPRGGAQRQRVAQARQAVERPPSTVHPDTWELKQLKHAVRWTIYVPQAVREELQRRAAARGQHPSLLVQEALARWLAEEPCTRDRRDPGRAYMCRTAGLSASARHSRGGALMARRRGPVGTRATSVDA